MCTVTYIPRFENRMRFVLTDNRDESINRPAAPPAMYKEYGAKLYYPKDKKAGGTWFGVGSGSVVTLMNGAFKPHQRLSRYRESRGVVVKKLVAAPSVEKAFSNYNLEGIEAFFAVVVSWKKELRLFEMIWDGKLRYIREKDATRPAIWSSAMLYSDRERRQKEARFVDFMNSPLQDDEAVWALHHTRGNKDSLGFVIDRGVLQTTSVSQLSCGDDKAYFRYEDLILGQVQSEEIKW